MSPITDPERQRKASRECMAKLLRRRKLYEIFGTVMEGFLIHLELLQDKKRAIHFKLFAFRGMKWFLPVEPSSPISEEILLTQKYEILKIHYKAQRIPFVETFEEFKQGLEVYNRTYEIKCVDE